MPLDEAYFTWLYSQVGSVDLRNRSKTYWKLLTLLYKKEFIWSTIEKDGNRAQDGRDLRQEFLDVTGTIMDEPGWTDFPCSMLELMVALSRKLAFQGEGKPSDWFWGLIENLGLIECTDTTDVDQEIIEHILDKVIYREYAKNGAGGLFPLQRHSRRDKDQTQVELWYQAEAYLLERL